MWAEPEVVFRIVRVALAEGSPPTAYREQTVEVALGPNVAFQGGDMGRLTRRVPLGQVVRKVPQSRRKARPPRPPKPVGPPCVVETLRKAIEWRRQLDAGKVPNQAAIARREGVSRARVTQIMGLLRLTPTIQENILDMSNTRLGVAIGERALRSMAQLRDSKTQIAQFTGLCPNVA